uniref:Uncharacterized protein n=1 Tax=Triticum urartu TaxID=4572 RepID=A0A8R7QK61_TRIUA
MVPTTSCAMASSNKEMSRTNQAIKVFSFPPNIESGQIFLRQYYKSSSITFGTSVGRQVPESQSTRSVSMHMQYETVAANQEGAAMLQQANAILLY